MANPLQSLDEIISAQRSSKGRSGGGGGNRQRGGRGLPPMGRRRSGGPGGQRSGGGGGGRPAGGRFTFSNDVPAGKWKHDKFNEENGGGSGRRTGGGGGGGRIGGGFSGGSRSGRGADVVQLNISNLPSSVITSDLEELFQDFNVLGLSVHYDETGAHLGTADLFVHTQTAAQIIREYRGIAIDNKEMKFALVDENAANTTIMDRIRRVRSNPIRDRKTGGGPRRSGAGPGARGRNAGSGGGKGGEKGVPKVEDLDKDLDSYMSKASIAKA